MKRRVLQVLGAVAFIIFVVGGFSFINTKINQIDAEAKTRCADPTIRKDRTVDQCMSYMRSYYHIYSQLPKVGFGAVVSAEQLATPTTTRTPAIERPMNPVAAVVGLPAGQQFMYIIPAEDAEKMRLGRRGYGNIYVTYEVKSGEFGLILTAPRLIRFLQAGNTPGSWNEVLYIQER